MGKTEMVFSTNLGDIHYWVNFCREDAPWLVFLPGLTADHHLFDKQVESFEQTHNCLSWDAPAHGESRPFVLEFSLVDMARYLKDILQIHGVKMPILVGQSFGGYLAQVYLDMFPDAVAGYISIDSGVLNRKYYAGWELALLKHTKAMYLSIPWKLLIKWGSEGNAESEYGRSLMWGMMESYSKQEYCALTAYGFRILAEAVETKDCYTITCPTLLLCGEKDGAGYVKKYNRHLEKEGFPVVWIPNAGHNSNTDDPQLVNKAIETFINRVKE